MELKKKLFIVVSVDWFFLSHRLPIGLEALKRGYSVSIFAVDEGKSEEIKAHGFEFIPLPTSRAGMNIFKELAVVNFLRKYYKREKPDVVHHVGVKPVTYGSIAAKLCGIPRVVNSLSGLGFLFINADANKLAVSMVRRMFSYGANNPAVRFILQNRDDYAMITDMNLVPDKHISVIKGSGVDLNDYAYSEEENSDPVKFLLPARMLWDKGIGEYVKAAEIINKKYPGKAKFLLAGFVDEGYKLKIEKSQLLAWNEEGNVEWIGFQSDMVGLISSVHVVVLPSYREGLPKSLIEACAIGRSIITTDVPGCREVVEDGINGLKVKLKSVDELAEAIEKLLLDKELRISMGKQGRALAEKEFSIDNVINKHFQIYES